MKYQDKYEPKYKMKYPAPYDKVIKIKYDKPSKPLKK